MKQMYKEINFRSDARGLIEFIDVLIEDYQQQGFTLSVRQLYYQLVARGMIENTERSYKRVASIINDGRLAGLLDWDAIEDRGRDIELQTRWDGPASIVQAAADSFHMDMWKGQEQRVFVIVEKAALAGVLGGVCRKWDVPLLAARGYPSVSVVRELVMEHFRPALDKQQDVLILHFGDHDPSGIDMTRDLNERIELFVEAYEHEDDNVALVRRVALTMPQIDEQKPPPNPAKTTDSRFASYRRQFGSESWELDALQPAFLVNLAEANIQGVLNTDVWNERKAEVEAHRVKLQATATKFAKNA